MDVISLYFMLRLMAISWKFAENTTVEKLVEMTSCPFLMGDKVYMDTDNCKCFCFILT